MRREGRRRVLQTREKRVQEVSIEFVLELASTRQFLAVDRQQLARQIAGPNEESLRKSAPSDHLSHRAHVHLRGQVNLLEHFQVSPETLQALVIHDQLAVHFHHLIFDVHDPLEPMINVHRKLLLRFGAPAADVAYLVVILQHDEQLSPMRMAEIGQDAGVAKVTRAILILHETLRQFALLEDELLGLHHQLFQREQPLTQTLDLLHILLIGIVNGHVHVRLEVLHHPLVKLLQAARALFRHLFQTALIVLRRDPSEQAQYFFRAFG